MSSRKLYGKNERTTTSPRHREQVQTLKIIPEAEELEYYTYLKCRSDKVFPKKDRGAMPTRMANEASDILADIMDANDCDLRDADERELRLAHQRNALRTCRLLQHHIRLIHRLGLINADVMAYWLSRAETVRNMCAAWHRRDKERAKATNARS